jgi:hypothetical protein
MRSLGACVAVLVAVTAAAPSGGATTDELQKRIDQLEQRVRELEATVTRQAELLERQGARGAAPAWPPGPAFRDNLDQMQDLIDRMQRQFGGGAGPNWGLPGPDVNPPAGPRHLVPPVVPQGKGGYLGVQISDGPDGVRIDGVQPGSAAAAGGLIEGDVVLSVDGTPTARTADLVALIAAHRPGDLVELRIRRAGAEQTVRVTLGTRDDAIPFAIPPMPGLVRPRAHAQPNAPGGVGNTMSLNIKTDAGELAVVLAMPGLFLTDEMVARLGLDENQRREVELAFGTARAGLAEEVSKAARGGRGALDAGAIAGLRRKAERDARAALAGKLPPAKIEQLERIHAEAAAFSSVSITARSGSQEGNRPGAPAPQPFDRGEEF